MKNFFSDIFTGALAFLAAVSGFVMISTGIAIVLQKPGLGLAFSISTVSFIIFLLLTVRRKGGWSDFVTSVFPWWP